MLALPGSAYLYQGEELGLPEVVDIPAHARQDPAFFRTDGERYGRDGCRVPLPWTADAPAFGYSPSGASWLPQPGEWARLARDVQRSDPDSTLSLYRRLLSLRRHRALGAATLEWVQGYSREVLAFRVGGVLVVANLGTEPVQVPAGELLASSEPLRDARTLPGDTAVWIAG